MEWVKLVIRSLLELVNVKGRSKYCKLHVLAIRNEDYVNWKRVVTNLLYIEEKWATDLAVRFVFFFFFIYFKNTKKPVYS